MSKKNDIPVHKVHIRNPKTGKMGWTFRVESMGTIDLAYIAERIGRRLLIDPRMAVVVFEQMADEIMNQVQYGFTVNMGTLGFMYPAIRDQGISDSEEEMTLHGTRGFVRWEPSKKTKHCFWNVGCTLDWKQRSRDAKRRREKQQGECYDAADPDDENFEDGYPLDIDE